MRIPARYWAPALLALILVIMLGSIFLWQIQTSIAVIEHTTAAVREKSRSLLSPLLPRYEIYSLESDAEALRFLRQGEVFVAQGELKKAEEKFSESVKAGGGVPALRKLANVQLQRRNYKEAKKTISTLKSEGANSNDILLLTGLMELRTGNVGAAKNIFEKSSVSAQGKYGLALVAIAVGEHERAQELLSETIQAGNPTFRTHARALLSAYDEFALFTDGRDTHLATLLARALAQVQECEIALPLLAHVVSQQGDYRDAWIVKGYCEFTTERFTEALASLENAYNIDPEKPETQYFLARTYFMLGDPQNAVTFLQYAVLNGFQPESDARLLLARFALELGNTELALEQYLALTELENSNFSAFEKYVGLALTLTNKEENAYQVAKIAQSKWPEDRHVLTLLAKTELATGRNSDAQEHLDQVVSTYPDHKEAREMLLDMRSAL